MQGSNRLLSTQTWLNALGKEMVEGLAELLTTHLAVQLLVYYATLRCFHGEMTVVACPS